MNHEEEVGIMLKEYLFHDISQYVKSSAFKACMSMEGPIKVEFLAQGEYNLNYMLVTAKGKYVLRINTASQIMLDNQIAYEYQALKLLENSGVTPRPYFLDDSKSYIPYGLLVMEYLPGEPLDYRYDLHKAAKTFAKLHGLMLQEKETDFLIRETGPFSGIYKEATDLLQKYLVCTEADVEIKNLLEKVMLKAEDKKKEEGYFLIEPWLAVINTEVNSHNFIVDHNGQTCHLIDWEKPIWGEPAQDLSMFLISTTTLWKRNYILSTSEEKSFLKEYLEKLPDCSYKSTLHDRVESFKFFNYLRAISWCAMAWTEYSKDERQLANRDTFEKIKAYLEPKFIKSIFPQVF